MGDASDKIKEVEMRAKEEVAYTKNAIAEKEAEKQAAAMKVEEVDDYGKPGYNQHSSSNMTNYQDTSNNGMVNRGQYGQAPVNYR